jgi:hypothetical protein
MVNTTFAKGHHAPTRRTARNLPTFSHASSTPNSLYIIIFCLGKTTIARIDSWRYMALNPCSSLSIIPIIHHFFTYHLQNYFELFAYPPSPIVNLLLHFPFLFLPFLSYFSSLCFSFSCFQPQCYICRHATAIMSPGPRSESSSEKSEFKSLSMAEKNASYLNVLELNFATLK